MKMEKRKKGQKIDEGEMKRMKGREEKKKVNGRKLAEKKRSTQLNGDEMKERGVLWSGTTKSWDVSTGPLAFLPLLTHPLSPHCLLRSRAQLARSTALIYSFTRSLPSSWESE